MKLVKSASKKALNDKQLLFCVEYPKDLEFDAVAAAKRAGYKGKSAPWQLMANPMVLAQIGKELQKRIERTRLSADDVLKHLTVALYLDPIVMFNNDFSLKQLKEIPKAERQCISKLKCKESTTTDKNGDVTVTTETEIQLMSKDKALDNAMRHFGLIAPDNKVNVNIDTVQLSLADLLHQVENTDNVIDVDSKGA